MTLVLADGEARLVLARVFTCPVILSERVIRTTFVAFPEHTSSKTLLGVDFLANANLVINIPRIKFSFCDNPDLRYDFCSEDNSENDASINLLDSTSRKDEAVQLDEIERTQLQAILEEHRDVFEENNVPTPFAEHCINLTSETPIAVPPYRMSPQKMDVLKSEVKSLLEKEIIEECDSPMLHLPYWSPKKMQAFLKLKELLTSSPILRQVDFTKPFTLKTDASSYALGACLLQGEGTDERPVEYDSRLITPAERYYTTTEREALAIEKFRGYVENSPILIKTDHQPLRWQMSLRSPKG
ncbi:hypothetical protein JTB14_026860 [Gonioctena quinquepunctata]|nr:hypothetical protein JTB14_026860 [Gonioctena quinquepunctata]